MVGRASHVPSNDLPTQARRPRYIQKSRSKLVLVSNVPRLDIRAGWARSFSRWIGMFGLEKSLIPQIKKGLPWCGSPFL